MAILFNFHYKPMKRRYLYPYFFKIGLHMLKTLLQREVVYLGFKFGV